MAEGETSSAMRDVERAATPLITQIPKITLSNKEIEEAQKCFNDFIDTITVDNTLGKLDEFKEILADDKLKNMEACYEQEKKNLQNMMDHLPDQKSFLIRFSLQEVLLRMLKDIAKYREFLKLFIDRFKAHKERIEGKHLLNKDTVLRPKFQNDPRTIRELDAPLHCAVRQLNKDFIEWLLEQPETEVNLRNKRRETALAILCFMYDWSKEIAPTLKPRLEYIEKERKKADKMQQIWLDDEEIELVALEKQLKEKSTILDLIETLLEKGADFNIYMNEGALPFDFLRRYDTETDVVKIINSYTKSNVAMTEKPPKQSKNSPKGKKVSKKRIVKFYKKTEDMNVRVTEELLEIFIRFNESKMFEDYWKDFTVTSDNVKKVITLLLYVAVELNFTTYVDHIIKKASKEIFKLEENKATDTRSVTSERNHIRWCCFKCCQKRHYPDSQTQSGAIEHRPITSDFQDNYECMSERPPTSAVCQNKKNLSSSEGNDSQTHGETFKQEKNETENSEDTRAGTSKRISMNTGDSCKDNPSATEGAEPQSQSGTSKLPATDPHTESATSKLEGTVSQTQSETIESQDTQPDSQYNHGVATVETPTSDEQPAGLCCLKCFQKSEATELKDLGPDSRNNRVVTPERTLMGAEVPSRWYCFKCCQKRQNPGSGAVTVEPTPMRDESVAWWRCFKKVHKKQKPSSPNSSSVKEEKLAHHAELKGLLKTVCENGNNALLKLFLFKINDRRLLNEHPLLINTIQKMSKVKEDQEIKYFQDCATTLIENHGKIRMQDTDQKKNTALHLALRYGYDKIASLLLKDGHGLMGLMNKQNLTPIEYGTTEFWNGYLNKCITINDETELSFNVGFLKPWTTNESSDSSKSSSCKWFLRSVASWICYWILFRCIKPVAQMSETHNTKYRFTRTVNDMTALRLISQSTDRKEFLMHPVIIAFITMKWKRLCHWHILNLLLTTFTLGTFMAYTLMSCPSGGWVYWFILCAWIVIVLREIMQMFLLGWSYVTLENAVDILNVVFIGIVLFCGCDRYGWRKYVPGLSSFVFVSMALQATFLLGATWNNLSITLYMFKTVSSSFFYSFLSFSPVIVAFICSFYQMYNEPSGISISNGTGSNSSAENFNNFHSSWDAAIKTLVMTTGEFEAANINYDSGRWLLFVAFLFIAPIVILNLINGLAVNDISDIRKESEFISVCKKVKLLERYERAIVDSRFTMPSCLQYFFCDPLVPNPFFENYESIIYVMTNEKNKLAIKIKKHAKEAIPCFPCLSSSCLKHYIGIRSFQFVLYMSLDQSYVNKAKIIARSQSKNNSGRGTSELADKEQTDRPTLVNKTTLNQYKTSTLSSPSVPDSRDKQIEMLQEQVRSMMAMLNDMQQQLSRVHSSKAESTAGMTGEHSRAQ